MFKKSLCIVLSGQLVFSSLLWAAPASQTQLVRQPSSPIDTGHFYISDLSDTDIQLMLDLASGDFFGISHQKLQDISSSPFYRVDPLFGPYLLTPPPNSKTFIANAEFTIGPHGELTIEEPMDKAKGLLGRSHTFSNWKVQKVFPTAEYVFIQVDSTSLPQGLSLGSKGISSMVAIRTSDLTQHLGARRILSTVIPLPFKMKDIEKVEYFDINSKTAKAHPGISALIGTEYKTGGYQIVDSQGREQFLPDLVPDVYSDMTRVLIRGLSATLSHNLALHEKLNPVLERYIKGLTKYLDKSNIKFNGAYQKIIDQALKNIGDKELSEVSMRETQAFSRRSLVTDINAPREGNYLTQLFGENKFTPSQKEEADQIYQTQVQQEFDKYKNEELAADTSDIEEQVKFVERELLTPYPTPEEIDQTQSFVERLKDLKNETTKGVKLALQGPLGNVAFVLFGLSLGYLFVEYTSVGLWATDYFSGLKSLKDTTILMNGVRGVGMGTVGLLSLLSAGYMANKWINKKTGKDQDFYMAIASLTRKFPVFWDALSRGKKMGYKLAFPFYAEAMFAGTLPTNENGGKTNRLGLMFFKIQQFTKNIYSRSNPGASSEAFEKSALMAELYPEERSTEKLAFEQEQERLEAFGAISFKRAWQEMNQSMVLRKKEIQARLDAEGSRWKQIKSWANSEILPDLAKAHGITTLELINKMAYSPGLLENETFLNLNEGDVEALVRNGRFEDLNKLQEESREAKDQAEFFQEKLLSLYISNKERAKLINKIKNSDEMVSSMNELKAIYYLTLAEAHKQAGKNASKEQVSAAFSKAKLQVQNLKSVDSATQKAIQTETKKAILFYQSTYRAIRDFQTEGLPVKLYTGLANVSPANVKYALQHEIPMDFVMERGMSYAEFYRLTQEMGVSFWASNMSELFDAHHMFGLFRPDAVSAFNNPINNVFMSPLSQANFGGRSGPDAVDKATIGTSMGYAAARQFLNPRRLREMQLLSRSFIFEVSRDLLRRFRSSSMQMFFLYSLFLGGFNPDMVITGYVVYWPMLKIGAFLNSKLMYATNTINYDKQEMIKVLESRYLDKENLKERFDQIANDPSIQLKLEREFITSLGLKMSASDKHLGWDKLAGYGPVYLGEIEKQYLGQVGVKSIDELNKKEQKALKNKYKKGQKEFNRLFNGMSDKMSLLVLSEMLLEEKDIITLKYLEEVKVPAVSQLNPVQQKALDKMLSKIQKQYNNYQARLNFEKRRTWVNPLTVYALNFLVILNVIYFFSERLGFEHGVVYEASKRVADLFGRPDLAFKLGDIQAYAVDHPLQSMVAISATLGALYAKKKINQSRERNKISKDLLRDKKALSGGALCSQLFAGSSL